jgi:L-rhamnose mutarotase
MRLFGTELKYYYFSAISIIIIPMKREAFKMYLKPGCEEEYEKRHAEIWPELRKLLSKKGVYDYSIYWDKDTNILFAFQKTKREESSQDMGTNPIVQKWWDYMADIMEVNPDNSPVSIPLPEVFHMD